MRRIYRAVAFGLLSSLFLVLLGGGVLLLQGTFAYDGTCGGLWPFIGDSRPCTLSEYLAQTLSFTGALLLREYWYIPILAAVVLTGAALAFEVYRSARPSRQR